MFGSGEVVDHRKWAQDLTPAIEARAYRPVRRASRSQAKDLLQFAVQNGWMCGDIIEMVLDYATWNPATLLVGDRLDVCDLEGKWVSAIVLAVDAGGEGYLSCIIMASPSCGIAG